MAANV